VKCFILTVISEDVTSDSEIAGMDCYWVIAR